MVSLKEIKSLKKYVRAANYLSAIQIYLKDNFLLDEPLSPDHIKPRLLGHWGTVPGINFIYANINRIIKKYNQEAIFLLGPGHGFPAIQSNLFLEGSLSKFYKDVPKNRKGISVLAQKFSWPYGFPSHCNPGAPGTILEGGELGYSLATAYGSVLDNPNLIAICVVGDGEAETASIATAWHCNKFLNPKTSGAVLPILHLNGYKISGPTILARMSDEELILLFEGYGYEPLIVAKKDPYKLMAKTVEKAYLKIKQIQAQSRSGKKVIKPKWPMIILRSPKGWTGIKELEGEKIEGNCLAHQVVASDVKHNPAHLKLIEEWFKSYKFNKLFNDFDGFDKTIKSLIPPSHLCMGQNKHAFAGNIRKELKFPNLKKLELKIKRGNTLASSMLESGKLLRDLFVLNKDSKNLRLFSPDETYSNKLNHVFEVTKRVSMWPILNHDKDLAQDGRIIEMLSENTLQGLLEGYILTGRHGLFVSYEAFVQIIASMVDQYLKFIKASQEFKWRKPVSSMNFILTSLGWRQDHNGFSHQNPGFITNMLEKHEKFVNVYFPVDANHMLVTMQECFKNTNCLNLIVVGKKEHVQWLTLDESKRQAKTGIMTWNFISDKNPDLIFAASGDYPTVESIAAIDILKKEFPNLKLRFVSVSAFNSVTLGKKEMTKSQLDSYFTDNKPVIYNFHGYPDTLKTFLYNYDSKSRFSVHGYCDEGSTTTPFDMQIRNGTSRYQLVIEALETLIKKRSINKIQANKLIRSLKRKIVNHKKYIIKYGDDPSEITSWTLN